MKNIMQLLRGRKPPTCQSAVVTGPDGVAVAQVDCRGDRPRIHSCSFHHWDERKAAELLETVAREHRLAATRCITLLAPHDYQLLMTEAPVVDTDELRDAVRWRIRELIGFPVEQAEIEVFPVPPRSGATDTGSVYAVVARRELIDERVAMFTGANIDLGVIDIPELAQRNLASLLDEDRRGVMLLSLEANSGLLTITREGQIYLSRTLDLGYDDLVDPDRQDDSIQRALLEVQRSLDYYDSHFRMGSPVALVLLPVPVELTAVMDQLASGSGLPVREFDLSQVLDCNEEHMLSPHCLWAVAAALRQEQDS